MKTTPRKIAHALAIKNGVPEAEAQQWVDGVFDAIRAALTSGGTVTVPGFGTFRGVLKPASRKQAFGREVSYGERLGVQFRRAHKNDVPAVERPVYTPPQQSEQVRVVDAEPKDELDMLLEGYKRKHGETL